MSRRDNLSRIYVGNLPPDVRTKDLEELFHKFGKIAFIDLKTRRGPPFAFVEFLDYRDAEDAVRSRDGKEWDGYRLRVEFPRGRERTSNFNRNGSKSSRGGPPQRRSKYRVSVSGLPPSGSWQDLKDHMRDAGEVCFADVYKGGEGVVEFLRYDDMRYALKKLNNSKFRSHEGENSYIKLREDAGGDSRSRSRTRSRSLSPVSKKRGSPSYSPARKRSPSDSRSRSYSRSPRKSKRSHRARTRSRTRSPTRSRSRSASRSRSRSGSRSTRSRRSRSASRSSRSASRSPRGKVSPRGKASPTRSSSDRGSRRGSKGRLDSLYDSLDKTKNSRPRAKSRSRSASRHSKSGTPSETPSRSGSPRSKSRSPRSKSRSPQSKSRSPRSKSRSASPARSEN